MSIVQKQKKQTNNGFPLFCFTLLYLYIYLIKFSVSIFGMWENEELLKILGKYFARME